MFGGLASIGGAHWSSLNFNQTKLLLAHVSKVLSFVRLKTILRLAPMIFCSLCFCAYYVPGPAAQHDGESCKIAAALSQICSACVQHLILYRSHAVRIVLSICI